MKPSRSNRRPSLSKDAQKLQALAEGLGQSASLVEDRVWQTDLLERLESHLLLGHEETVTEALEALFETSPRAHDALADHIEAAAESMTLVIDGQPYTALLIAIPVLAWSRYAVPSANLPIKLVNTLQTHFAAHVLAADTRLAMADYLFSPDQLPRTFCDTRTLLGAMTEAVLAGTALTVDHSSLPETNRFLADVRYLLAGALVPQGSPIFRWQEPDGKRDTALQEWQRQGLPHLESLMSGCAFEGLLANAYHAACRQADRAARPYAVHASVAFLHAVANTAPSDMQATVAACYERQLVEYRIALGPKSQQQVYHGVVWPLLGEGDSESNSDIPGEIEATLNAAGLTDIVFLTQHFPTEFCDDCGAPFYPNRNGELVHTEMPESVEQANMTLH